MLDGFSIVEIHRIWGLRGEVGRVRSFCLGPWGRAFLFGANPVVFPRVG